MREIQVYLDIDGVMCDIWKGMVEAEGITIQDAIDNNWCPKLRWLHEGGRLGFWNHVAEIGESFWSDLEKYEWADDLVSSCQEITGRKPIFLTKVKRDIPSCGSGKMIWLERHYPDLDYMICTEKSPASGSNYDFLIDDYDRNRESWERRGGSFLLFDQPWNEGGRTIKDIKASLRYYSRYIT